MRGLENHDRAGQLPLMRRDRTSVLETLVRIVLQIALLGVGGITFITHMAQIFALSFAFYATIVCGWLVLNVMGVVWWFVRRRGIESSPNVFVFTSLILLGLSSAFWTGYSNRPDSDDYYYLPNAVYYLEYPSEPMSSKIHFIHSAEGSFRSLFWGTSQPYEYAQGAFAYWSGFDLLFIYYLAIPLIVAFLLPLAWYYCMRQLSDWDYAAVAGAAVICFGLVIMRETHRTFGNFAFPRLFQGKAVLMSVGLPVFVGLSVDFFRSGRKSSWLALAASSAAFVGLSASAVPLVGLLAVCLGFAWFFSGTEDYQKRLREIVRYAPTLLYFVPFGLVILWVSASKLGPGSPVNIGWPTGFWGHLKLFVGHPPVTPILAIGTFAGVLLLFRDWRKRFLLAWIVVAIVVLNPLLDGMVIKYFTSPNIYWRLFYAFPFPLCLGLFGARVAEYIFEMSEKKEGALIYVVAPVIGTGIFMFCSHGKLKNGFGPKLPRQFRWTHDISQVTPQGPMLACSSQACLLSLASPDHPQLRVKEDGIQLWLGGRGRGKEAKRRIAATEFLETGAQTKFDDFVWIVENMPELRSVVSRRRAAKKHDISTVLKQYAFTRCRRIGNKYIVYTKSQCKGNTRTEDST